MRTPKTLVLIECRLCHGSYYGGENNLMLRAGSEKELPDEVSIVVRKVARCTSCKEVADRTYGSKRKRFER